MANGEQPPSATGVGRVELMFEQLSSDMKLMHEAITLRLDSVESTISEGFLRIDVRLTALEKTVREHSLKIDALHGMVLDNREAIEANRREIAEVKVLVDDNRREIAAVKALVEGIDERLRTQVEPRIAAVEARVDAIEAELDRRE